MTQIDQSKFTKFRPNGVRGIFGNCVLQAPGLRVHGGSASPLAQTANGFAIRCEGVFSAPVSGNTDMPALAGGNLAFDNGTVPPTTGCCRMYTFTATVNPATGVATFATINGADFTKNRATLETDVNLGDSKSAIVGYLYVKNESNAVFIPGTTNLDAAGITARFSDAFGYITA